MGMISNDQTISNTDEYNALRNNYAIKFRTVNGDEGLGYSSKARQIFGLCDAKGLYNNEFFAEWFLRAFPEHPIDSYCSEWIGRFLAGAPSTRMDSERREIFVKVIEHFDSMKTFEGRD